jgi:nucleoside diphosphate kinase
VLDAGLFIEGLKALAIDANNLKQKASKEKDPSKVGEIKEALKVPSVMIVIRGKEAIGICEKIKDEFGDNVHTSSNEETAKYEISRFFKDEELFDYDENDFSKILGGESSPKLWRKYKDKSIKEIENEAKKKQF